MDFQQIYTVLIRLHNGKNCTSLDLSDFLLLQKYPSLLFVWTSSSSYYLFIRTLLKVLLSKGREIFVVPKDKI